MPLSIDLPFYLINTFNVKKENNDYQTDFETEIFLKFSYIIDLPPPLPASVYFARNRLSGQ